MTQSKREYKSPSGKSLLFTEKGLYRINKNNEPNAPIPMIKFLKAMVWGMPQINSIIDAEIITR